MTSERYLAASAVRHKAPIAKYSHVDLRFALDNAVRDSLVLFFGYSQSHHLFDLHLLFGYIAAISSIVSAVYGYTHPFNSFTKQILLLGSGIYFACIGVMALITHYKGDLVFSGANLKSGDKIDVFLKVERFEGATSVIVRRGAKEAKVGTTIGSYFTSDGNFCPDRFLDDMKIVMAKIDQSK